MLKKSIFLFISISFIVGLAVFFVDQQVFGVTGRVDFASEVRMSPDGGSTKYRIGSLPYPNADKDLVTKEYAGRHFEDWDDDWVLSGTDIYTLLGRVGIGTSGPGARLHVKETVVQGCVGTPISCENFNGNQSGCNNQQGCFWTSKNCKDFGGDQWACEDAGCQWDWEFGFCMSGTYWGCDGSPTPCSSLSCPPGTCTSVGCSCVTVSKAAIFEGGRVGIGTTAPSYDLHVVGTCGGGSSCNEDIAEIFSKCKDELLEPGDVVVLSGDSEYNLYKSTQPYDIRVAGVYSTDPGMLIRGEDGVALSTGPQDQSEFSDTQLPLAIAGKVIVKVINENGAIKKGDILTTSSTPGYAMKCPVETDEQKLKCRNAVLSKALEPCDETTCKILTLISLQ